jgi:hypothetical protein
VEHLGDVLDRFLAHGQTNTSVIQSSAARRRNPPLPAAEAPPDGAIADKANY